MAIIQYDKLSLLIIGKTQLHHLSHTSPTLIYINCREVGGRVAVVFPGIQNKVKS